MQIQDINIAIIGGGAGGFFSAIAVKENYPNANVVIFEKSRKLLSKVKVSGGGRCNLTNACTSLAELSKAYPRNGKAMKKALSKFSTKDTINWFESRGVELITQEDNCIFPKSQDSQTIIDCFLYETKRLRIKIELEQGIKSIIQTNNGLQLNFINDSTKSQVFDKVIVATGGSPKAKGLDWLKELNHQIEIPVPSLFTFNMPTETITKLMGIVAKNITVNIQGTKFKSTGALLITHWGMSGPVILKLSSFGARILNEKNYEFNIQVNWTNKQNSNIVADEILEIINKNPDKILQNIRPYALQERLWLYLLEKSNLSTKKKWKELGKKGLNKLVNTLTNDIYSVKGKTTFKEEFVTCGGVSLESIDINTMQSKICKNLYFTGEVLDIDGITGGYNLQAAWSTGFIAGKLSC